MISSETAGSSREGVRLSTGFFHPPGERDRPIDTHKLLEELRGQPGLIPRLLHVFQAEAQKDIDGLEAALEARDFARVAALAHRLKGSAATIGAGPLKIEAAQIERLGRQGRLGDAHDHLSDLRREFARVCGYMCGLRDLEQSPAATESVEGVRRRSSGMPSAEGWKRET